MSQGTDSWLSGFEEYGTDLTCLVLIWNLMLIKEMLGTSDEIRNIISNLGILVLVMASYILL
jgi:hypothetical protein